MRQGARGRHDEAGLSLIEVIIATFILSVAVLAVASTASSSLISLRESRAREQATNAASAAIEAARSRDFGALVLDPAAVPTGLPADIQTLFGISGACAGGERILQDAASSDPVPLSQDVGNNDAITVYTLVTWADEPCTATFGDLKRVIAYATWQDGARMRSVRNETLVAPAGRGLPVPNFEIKPPEAALAVTPDQAASGSSGERCVEHQLRNLGAKDSYEWEVIAVTGGSDTATRVGNAWTVGGDWSVRAFIEHPAVDARGGAVPADGLMQDTDGNGRPESDAQVEPRDRALVSFCYASTDGAAADPIRVEIDVVSRFDERRTEQLVHEIAVADPIVRLHLQDRDDTQPHVRKAANGNEAKQFPPYRMNPLNELSGDRLQLLADTIQPWGTELYSTAPGLPLRRAQVGTESTRLRTVDFRYAVASPSQLLPGGLLRIWTAPVTALTTGTTAPTRVVMTVELDVLDENENNRLWPTTTAPFTTTLDYLHTGTGFVARDIPLEFTGGLSLAANERMRVRLTCHADSAVDCVVGYDSLATPSYLQVGLQ